jgi:cytochrome c peroxidase
MRLRSLSLRATVCLIALSVASVTYGQTAPTAPPPYNPYPPGILPANLPSELARVLREVDTIEAEAIRQWKATPAPVVAGNPPILQNTGVASVEILGKLMNYDRTISSNENKACASCHMPYAGFSGPIPSVDLTMIAYPASYPYQAAKRTAQRYTYSSYFRIRI